MTIERYDWSGSPRLRQSLAKILLQDCPALCLKQLQRDSSHGTRAMQRGSLLDYLVFGQDDRYEIVDARYRSGPREGEPCTDWTGKEAQQAREEIGSRGILPVLESEVAAMNDTADAIRLRIIGLSLEMAGTDRVDVIYQPRMEWTSALGVECAGTPDVVVVVHLRDLTKVCTIDVKHTAALGKGKFERQVADMCWDVQCAAYAEGSVAWAEQEYGAAAYHSEHVILATSSIESGLPPVARRLAPAFMAGGKRRWEAAQRIWQACVDSKNWPGYDESPVEPSFYYVRQYVEAYDPSQALEEEP